MAVKASRTSSSLNGLMIAITIFMGRIPAWARSRGDRAFSTEGHHAEKVHYAGTAGPLESNAVPDRACSLTDYERGPFCALRESAIRSRLKSNHARLNQRQDKLRTRSCSPAEQTNGIRMGLCERI